MISDTASNWTHNLFRPKCAPIPLGHSDKLLPRYVNFTTNFRGWNGIRHTNDFVRHCGLVGSAPVWDGTGCKFDSWQCRIYIPCSLSLRLLGFLRGSLGTCGLTQKLCFKKDWQAARRLDAGEPYGRKLSKFNNTVITKDEIPSDWGKVDCTEKAIPTNLFNHYITRYYQFISFIYSHHCKCQILINK